MSNDQKLIEEYTKKIEEFQREHADSPQPWQSRAREERRGDCLHLDDRRELNQLNNELNLLNSKKLKAEMLGKTDLCNEYQAKIDEHESKLKDFKSKLQTIERPPPTRPQNPVNSEQPLARADNPPNSERPARRYNHSNTERSTGTSNSANSEKQRKADEDYASKLLEQCKREVDELRSRQQGMPRRIISDPKKLEYMNELNVLNVSQFRFKRFKLNLNSNRIT